MKSSIVKVLQYIGDSVFKAIIMIAIVLPILLVTSSKYGIYTSPKTSSDTVYIEYIDTVFKTDTLFIIRETETVSTPKVKKKHAHVLKYIEEQMPYAQMLEDSFGIDKWFALAQPAFESGWATSYSAKYRNNLWGIKKCKGYDSEKGWAKFKDLEEGWRKYAERINYFKKGAQSTEELIQAIASSPYAARKNKQAVEDYIENIKSCLSLIKSYANGKLE